MGKAANVTLTGYEVYETMIFLLSQEKAVTQFESGYVFKK